MLSYYIFNLAHFKEEYDCHSIFTFSILKIFQDIELRSLVSQLGRLPLHEFNTEIYGQQNHTQHNPLILRWPCFWDARDLNLMLYLKVGNHYLPNHKTCQIVKCTPTFLLCLISLFFYISIHESKVTIFFFSFLEAEDNLVLIIIQH